MRNSFSAALYTSQVSIDTSCFNMKREILISLLLFVTNYMGSQSYNNSYNTNTILYSETNKPQKEIVITPFGLQFRSNVHYVDNNRHLLLTDKCVQIIDENTQIIKQQINLDISNYLSKLEKSDSSLSFNTGEGYITYAECQIYVQDPKPDYFSTEWIVPNNPKNSSRQTIFLFNGLEGCKKSINGNYISYILQPVLQWGGSAAGGGKYWSICNWLVTNDDQVFYDSLIKVHSGDKLHGMVKLISYTDSTYNYNSSFAGYSGGLNINNLPRLQTPVIAMEAYNINGCDDYPADEKMRMYNIQIITDSVYPPVIWQTQNLITNCGQFTNIIDDNSNNGEVNIHFHKPYSKDKFEDIYVYPNPIQNDVYISITNPIYNCRIEVYNSFGNLLHTENHKTLEYEYNLDFHEYLTGLYFIKIYYQINLITWPQSYTFKVIKIRPG